MFKVICPKCKHYMNYMPKNSPKNKTKKCVYCGKSFVVLGEIENRIIKKL